MPEENVEIVGRNLEAFNRRDLRRVLDDVSGSQLEPHDFTEAGSEVVVWNTAHMRGRDGIEVSARTALVYTVETGRSPAFGCSTSRARRSKPSACRSREIRPRARRSPRRRVGGFSGLRLTRQGRGCDGYQSTIGSVPVTCSSLVTESWQDGR